MQSKASRPTTPSPARKPERSEFADSLQKGALIGGALLLLIVPPLRMGMQQHAAQKQPVVAQAQQAPAAAQPATEQQQLALASQQAVVSGDWQEVVARRDAKAKDGGKGAKAPAAKAAAPKLADFGAAKPTPEVRLMANWSVASGDHKKAAFVVVDKKDARVYVFAPNGKLRGQTPVLLGSAVGDDTVPGIGDKPLSQVKADEKTTPAGRFIAEVGLNARKEDVVWVDYNAAVSMHRVLRTAEGMKEKRLQRLATPTAADNRISYGCINVPVSFFEKVLAPTVRKNGAVIYVLPETRPVEKQFAGIYDPAARVQMAQAAASGAQTQVPQAQVAKVAQK